MDLPTRQLITAIHQTSRKCLFVLAGGGTGAVADLLGVPGGSRTVVEAVIPYGEQTLAEFLGAKPAQFCSAETSRRMAGRAFDRARWLCPGEPVLGLGCTATLATDRPKRGDHRVYLALRTEDETVTHALTFHKDARDRAGEEAVVDALLVNALAEGCGVPDRLPVPLLPGEAVAVERCSAPDPLAAVLCGPARAVCVETDGRVHGPTAEPAVILPGAFNPLHHGHWELATVAARRTGLAAAFELSVTNVDKPPLPAAEVRRRAAQFGWKGRLWVTRAPTFAEKALLFPRCVFAVGADTAERIVHPRYYEDRPDRMAAALVEIRTRGCRFLVAGREDASGRFVGCADLTFPEPFADLFESIPEDEFRVVVSSTQLRAAAVDRPPGAA